MSCLYAHVPETKKLWLVKAEMQEDWLQLLGENGW